MPGLGPEGHTESICHIDHAHNAAKTWDKFIESMVTAAAHNIRDLLDGKEATYEATWNAVCLADMGDTGIAFVAMPQIPPRNVTWAKSGKWVHVAKVAFEKYFLRKVRKGTTDSYIEHSVLKLLGIEKLKEVKRSKE